MERCVSEGSQPRTCLYSWAGLPAASLTLGTSLWPVSRGFPMN